MSTVISRFLFIGLMVLTVASAVALAGRIDGLPPMATAVLRVALVLLTAYLWVEWYRADRRAS
jgi:FtsH-binding integral membrane protein